VPYSYFCWDYPLIGCDDWEFWWNLPTDWDDYRGVKWGSYFTINGFITAVFVFIFGKIVSKIVN
jgi:hypothetical protein